MKDKSQTNLLIQICKIQRNFKAIKERIFHQLGLKVGENLDNSKLIYLREKKKEISSKIGKKT
jgi:hypothetical protein